MTPPKQIAPSVSTDEANQSKSSAQIIALATKASNPAPGATSAEWAHFDVILGYGADLLPVVSNQAAQISPNSAMKALGKTPSRYNNQRLAVGIPKWTEHVATSEELDAWSSEPDYGISIQCRAVRAIDVDIPDENLANQVRTCIDEHLGAALPCRMRSNASKFLLAFTMPGELFKRVIKCQHGIIELLGNGQQFVACGVHTSGVRYEWHGGLPYEIPALTLEQVDCLWQALADKFAVEAPSESNAPTKAKVLAEAIHSDPTAQHLLREGYVLKEERDGRLHITCPFEDEHTAESSDSSTTYFSAHTGGFERGHFDCKHAHCEHRTDQDFLHKLGVDLCDFEDMTDALSEEEAAESERCRIRNEEAAKRKTDSAIAKAKLQAEGSIIAFVDFASLAHTLPPARVWIVQEWLPRGSVTTLFGRGGHGKSLLAQQLATAVANGAPWLDIETTAGAVLGLFCEDEDDELQRRQHAIFLSAFMDPADGSRNLYLDARPGKFNTLVSFGADRLAAPTLLMFELRSQCEKIRPVLVILDNIAQLFAGQENARTEVTQFCNELTGLARTFDCAVLLLGHTAKAEGSEYSGSTAWDAAVRSRLFLERQDDGTTLLRKVKANYSALDEIRLSYLGGSFAPLPAGSQNSAEVIEAIKPLITGAIERFTARKISTSHNPTARNYLIKQMKNEGMLGAVGEKAAHAAMVAMIDQAELETNAGLPWKSSSRHPVSGLAVAK